MSDAQEGSVRGGLYGAGVRRKLVGANPELGRRALSTLASSDEPPGIPPRDAEALIRLDWGLALYGAEVEEIPPLLGRTDQVKTRFFHGLLECARLPPASRFGYEE